MKHSAGWIMGRRWKRFEENRGLQSSPGYSWQGQRHELEYGCPMRYCGRNFRSSTAVDCRFACRLGARSCRYEFRQCRTLVYRTARWLC
jgi:hypothetical protein